MSDETPSINRQMLTISSQSASLFDPDTADLITRFVLSRQNPDGGFRGKSPGSDLYYTLFAIECLCALNHESFDTVQNFLYPWIDSKTLDFVHTACLIRSLARLSKLNVNLTEKLITRLDRYKTHDGLFHMETRQPSIYASFLGMAAYQACGIPFRQQDNLIELIEHLKTPDGAYADEPGMALGTTPVTAAAVVLQAHLKTDISQSALVWLKARKTGTGGFSATTRTPLPDLLSTATALFALKIAGIACSVMDESLQDFIESVWTDYGGFCGTPFDAEPDVEYTFYGLLAAGVLADEFSKSPLNIR